MELKKVEKDCVLAKRRYILFLLGTTTLLGVVMYFEAYGHIQNIERRNVSESDQAPCHAALLITRLPPDELGDHISELEKAEVVNEKRKNIIREFCNLKKPSLLNATIASWTKKGVHSRPRLYFSDTMKLILCETPKCGTTQWRNLMLIMDGHLDGYAAGSEDNFPLSKKHNFMWTRYNLKIKADVSNVTERLRKYYKIMTTREPLERLVSAYRDKLEANNNPSYSRVSKRIHKAANPKSSSGSSSFEEFIDYILSTKDRKLLDPHWKPYSELCDPCNIDYDHIAKMETVYDDAEVITRNIGIARDRIFNATGRAGVKERRTELFHQYFLRLSVAKREAIFRYYKDQYDMFDYDYPDFISDSKIHIDE